MTPSLLSPNPNAPYYDTPFIYSKVLNQLSGAPLSGATADYPTTIASDGDSDFFARRATNLVNFNDAAGQSFITIAPSSLPIQATAIGFDMPLAPEKLFPLGTSVPVLLAMVNGQLTPNVATLAYTGGTAFVTVACPSFQGIKRRKGSPNTTPNYQFRETPYSYVLPVTQNWTYLLPPFSTLSIAPARTFNKTVLNWDFELQCIEVSADFDNNASGQSTYAGFLMKLYDANGYALMSDFVHYRQISYTGGFAGNTKTSVFQPGDALPWYPNCFPVPPIIYPKGGIIRIDIMSLLDNSATNATAPSNLKIHYRGVNRVPC